MPPPDLVADDDLADFEDPPDVLERLDELLAEPAARELLPDEDFDAPELERAEPPPDRDEPADLPDLELLPEVVRDELDDFEDPDRLEFADLPELPERDGPPLERELLVEEDLPDEDLLEPERLEADLPELADEDFPDLDVLAEDFPADREELPEDEPVDFELFDPEEPEERDPVDFFEDDDPEPDDLFGDPEELFDDADFEPDDFFDEPDDEDFDPEDFFEDDDDREPDDFLVAAILFLLIDRSFNRNVR